jgi:hypothetical protein
VVFGYNGQEDFAYIRHTRTLEVLSSQAKALLLRTHYIAHFGEPRER